MQDALQATFAEPIDIVVVGDNTEDLKLIARLDVDLDHHCNVHGICDSGKLESMLLDYHPTLVFVNDTLGEHKGIELIRQFSPHFPDIAFVLVTAKADESTMLAATRAGASDFLRKSDITATQVDELIARVLNCFYRHSYARMAITILNDGLATIDAGGQIVRCNPAIEMMMDEDESELLGRPFEQLFHAEDKDKLRALFSLSDNTRNSQPELRLQSHAGNEILVKVSVNGLMAARNKNFIVILKEVLSDLRSVDKQLAIIEASPDFIGYCNGEGEIQFLNPAAKNWLGIEALGDHNRITLLELFAPIMRRSFATHIFAKLAKKGQFVGNGLVDGKYCKSLPASIIMNGLVNADGTLNTITFSLREISPPTN